MLEATVPKHLIKLNPGSPIPTDIRDFLGRFFESKDLERLERLGGRVLVTITAPYSDARGRKANVLIDTALVEQLISQRNSAEMMQATLTALRLGQLKELCALLGQPVRSGASRAEIIADIVRTLRDQDLWARISSSTRKQE